MMQALLEKEELAGLQEKVLEGLDFLNQRAVFWNNQVRMTPRGDKEKKIARKFSKLQIFFFLGSCPQSQKKDK